MNPERPENKPALRDLFLRALELQSEPKREAYLQDIRGKHPELYPKLTALLRNEKEDSFLEYPAAEGVATLAVSASLSEGPGTIIGKYKLLEQLGAGGFGVVYMAEQKEPVKRRVALKIIKVGMDTREVVARFEAERQALAIMDHPNIAKVHDGGATDTGRPYFVMELVRGVEITKYCDEKNLSTRERLNLFTQVCHAVQHAHQKGIIHRDLKPSNILVTVNDGVPVPKVIDFGIAKATQLELTEKTVFTRFHQFIGTPAYLSPEQADISSVDIDTRSDIYSLGVLLYELLTGKTPFDGKELLKIGLDEMRRTIREKEPERPSTRVSTLGADELTTTAKRRGVEPPKLANGLRGDLDWIVMKCLEKDRARRYETASGLANDIERHLSNEPVSASPPESWYRFQKWVRRNKTVFMAGSAVAVSLVMGLSLSTLLFFRERAARQRANEQEAIATEQAAIAQAINDFLQRDLLSQADSRSQAEARFAPNPNLTVREALERAAERINDRFKHQPLEEASVRSAIGNAFEGVGEHEKGIPHLQRALELFRGKLGPDHPEALTAMNNLAEAYQAAGKLDQALPLLEETLKLRKAKLGPDHPDTLNSMNNLAGAYQQAGKFDIALPLFEETLTLLKAKLGIDHPSTLSTMNNLAVVYQAAGKLDQALPLLEETLKLRKAKLGPDHPDTLTSMNNLALCYQAAGKLDLALPLGDEALKLAKAGLGPDHPVTLTSMNNLALAYYNAGKPDLARPLFEETLKLRKVKLGMDHPDTLISMNNLALTYQAAGMFDRAFPLDEETLKLEKAKLGPDHPDTLTSMNNLAGAYELAGKLDLALPLFEETLKLTKAKLGPDHPNTLQTMFNLAALLTALKKYPEADTLNSERAARTKERDGPLSASYATVLAQSGMSLVHRREWDKAEPVIRECLGIREKIQPDDWSTFNAESLLGGALLGKGKLGEAQPLVVAGYKGLKERADKLPVNAFALTDAFDRLDVFYESCKDRPEAAKWKAEIEHLLRLDDPGAIRRWLILSPIALEAGQSYLQGLELEQLSSEATLRPRAGERVSVGDRDLTWQKHTLRHYAIDFNNLLGAETPRSVAYAVCYVRVDAPRRGLVLKVGSDDLARLYVNGQKIYEQKNTRPLRLDQDTVSDVELQAGLNALVFKVVNGTEGWGGSVRFTDKEDRPIQGIQIVLAPD